MNKTNKPRFFDYYDYYSKRIDELNHYIQQQATKGHGRRKIKEQSRRFYRNGIRPSGVHDYHNMQWDPSIYRGRTFRDFREKNLPPNDSTVNFNKYCCVDCTGSRFSPMSRRKTRVGFPKIKVGGIFRPTTDDIIFEESSGRKRHKQVDQRKEMEPFIVEQFEPLKYSQHEVQTDEIKMAPRKMCHHVAIGTSTSSQANICIIGTESGEDPLKPIVVEVGAKVLEQGLLETFEEYELCTIRSEIRSFMQKRRNREARERKEVEKQLTKAEWRELERIQRANEEEIEQDAGEKITAIFYSINACNAVLSQAFESLRQQGFLPGDNRDAEMINPWLHQQMYRHLQVPRMVVNDIIQTVENDKLTEHSLGALLQSEKFKTDEVQGEDEDFSRGNSVTPPPNTLMYLTTSEEEDN